MQLRQNAILHRGWLSRPVGMDAPNQSSSRFPPHAYEGREVGTDGDEGQIDRWFEFHTSGLSNSQRADPKRKMSRAREMRALSHGSNPSPSMRASTSRTTSKEPG